MGKNLSGPQFLLTFLTEKHLDENLVKVFMPKAYPMIYCCYIALSNVDDLDRSWISSADYDKEESTVVLQLSKKRYAKKIKDSCSGTVVEYGKYKYNVSVKISDEYAIIGFDEMD